MIKYTLTQEHKTQLKPWAEKWIKNAFSTHRMSVEDKKKVRYHVKELYKAANLKPLPDHKIIFVESPFIARFAGGFAAWALYCKKNNIGLAAAATDDATTDATYDATAAATADATRAATADATADATAAATRAATAAATADATRAATAAATDDATADATADATYAATADATRAATYAATDAATADATAAATRAATYAATAAATTDATYDATAAATADATAAATRAATYAATAAATTDATYDATYDATAAATYAATYAATDDATYAATRAATYAATADATRAATYAATDDATYAATAAATADATAAATAAATDDATAAATAAATDDATDAATAAMNKINNQWKKWYIITEDFTAISNFFGGKPALTCAQNASRIYNGGNFWSGHVAFISFFRYVAKLKLDYSKWSHYEALAELSSFRIMHTDFCLISERPIKLSVDTNNAPHCDDGPFCEWADGSKLYTIHGVRVPAWIVEFPEAITIEKIQGEQNLEVQRIMIEKYGAEKYLCEIDSVILDMDTLSFEGSAPRILILDKANAKWLIGTDGSTKRVYTMALGNANVKTCSEAHKMICGFDETRLIVEA